MFKFLGRGRKGNGTVGAGRQPSQKTGQWRTTRMSAWRWMQQTLTVGIALKTGGRCWGRSRGKVRKKNDRKGSLVEPLFTPQRESFLVSQEIVSTYSHPKEPCRVWKGKETVASTAGGEDNLALRVVPLKRFSLQKAKPRHPALFSKWPRSRFWLGT